MTRLCAMIAPLVVAVGSFLPASAVAAVELYIDIPSIPGEDATPGYPGAIAVSSLTIAPNTLYFERQVDAASPDIVLAAINGTQLGTVKAMLYNTAPSGAPDATLDFLNTMIGAYGLTDPTTEAVSFNADNPRELYLEVPGIPGVSSTPGYSNVMQILGITLSGNSFVIGKMPDTASDDLFLASALGTQFPVARLLVYDSLPLQGSPDAVIEFQNLLISSYENTSPNDEVTFSFTTFAQVPEPATVGFIGFAAMALLFATTQRRRAAR